MADEHHELDTEEPVVESNEWITTFADMSLLLLVFFILLFSMSTIDQTKFTDSFLAVKVALGQKEKELMTARVKTEEAAILDTVRMQKQLIESQRKVFSDVRTFITRKGVEGVVGAVLEEGKITLRVPGDVLFAPGQVELGPQGKKVIRTLKDFLAKSVDQHMNIKGFTDDVPPSRNSRFKDNWEISSLRAVYVLRYLMELGLDQKRLTATGLADLEPLYPNNTAENRARNRRVEIVLEKRVSK
ncbi:OmpA/MotB family protein [Desulfovibrio ferrophilus]|uniref:OmpA/MotB domain-containing protein n=1 Tax=Desulfovibrio ferrophilus TaxID=241368 RepID=A0A2Z6AY25_9BACT|nr:OmpA family protein [Desulfovibrio ferrophilus]BBD08103.1 OmpA/MotB domain-containing protein [Desulfovibrio ferrophilus]